MEAINYSTFRQNLTESMDKVDQDRTPLLITRRNGSSAVLISLDEYNAYMETAHLSSSSRNAKRLNRAIAELEAGKSQSHELIETDE